MDANDIFLCSPRLLKLSQLAERAFCVCERDVQIYLLCADISYATRNIEFHRRVLSRGIKDFPETFLHHFLVSKYIHLEAKLQVLLQKPLFVDSIAPLVRLLTLYQLDTALPKVLTAYTPPPKCSSMVLIRDCYLEFSRFPCELYDCYPQETKLMCSNIRDSFFLSIKQIENYVRSCGITKQDDACSLILRYRRCPIAWAIYCIHYSSTMYFESCLRRAIIELYHSLADDADKLELDIFIQLLVQNLGKEVAKQILDILPDSMTLEPGSILLLFR